LGCPQFFKPGEVAPPIFRLRLIEDLDVVGLLNERL
jgi:hypothetical protein